MSCKACSDISLLCNSITARNRRRRVRRHCQQCSRTVLSFFARTERTNYRHQSVYDLRATATEKPPPTSIQRVAILCLNIKLTRICKNDRTMHVFDSLNILHPATPGIRPAPRAPTTSSVSFLENEVASSALRPAGCFKDRDGRERHFPKGIPEGRVNE